MKTERTKSIQDMQRTLVDKARESRAVSFSGVSVMVDAALRLSSFAFSDHAREEVDKAVTEDNWQEIKRLISSGTTDLHTALVSTLERVSINTQ